MMERHLPHFKALNERDNCTPQSEKQRAEAGANAIRQECESCYEEHEDDDEVQEVIRVVRGARVESDDADPLRATELREGPHVSFSEQQVPLS